MAAASSNWLRARARTSESGRVGFVGGRDSLWSREAISVFGVIDESAIRQRFELLAPLLDERGRRRIAAAEATSAGHGGIVAVMRATDIARTISSSANSGAPHPMVSTISPTMSDGSVWASITTRRLSRP